MTLVLSMLTPHGIAMAADSAMTWEQHGRKSVFPFAVRKLQVIPSLSAAIGCWGLGTLQGKTTGEWLTDFVESLPHDATVDSMCKTLADTVNGVLGNLDPAKVKIGFQVAAYVRTDNGPQPTFYHVHSGRSEVLEGRGERPDPYRVNANHDWPPELLQQLFAQGQIHVNRTGDYTLFAHVSEHLYSAFKDLGKFNVQVPHVHNIMELAEFLAFQIRLVVGLTRFSNLPRNIGGVITYVGINKDGVQGVNSMIA